MKIIKNIFLYIIIFLYIFTVKVYATELNNALSIGSKAPYFNLEGYSQEDSKVNSWSIDDFKGKWLILYFYPKDFTSGCTIEAKGFERIVPNLKEINASLVGISNDSTDDHESFCNEEKLSFVLLTDKNGKTSKDYNSWNKPYSKRNTFLIDPEGVIKYKWNNVNPSKNPKEVLDLLNKRLEL